MTKEVEEVSLECKIKEYKEKLVGMAFGSFIFLSAGALCYFGNMAGLKGNWLVLVSEWLLGAACLYGVQYYNHRYTEFKIMRIFWDAISRQVDSEYLEGKSND